MIKAWMYWDSGGYGVRWYEGDGTADIVTALPEHSPTGELIKVGEVTMTSTTDAPLADVVLALPDLLDAWPRPHETAKPDAIKHAKQRAADEFGVNFPL